jgi:hypothetical protein
MTFFNLAGEYTETTGTSDCVLTTAIPGFNTWVLAGAPTGEVVRYRITTFSTTTNRPTHSEVGLGTYTTATKTLARTTVESSTAAGAKITLTGLSEVYLIASAKDFNTGVNPFSSYYQNGASTSVANTVTAALLDIDTEWVDQNNISSLAADVVTISSPGWYEVTATVGVSAGAAFNGYISVYHNQQSGPTRGIYVTANAILSDTFTLPPTLFQVLTTGTVDIKLDNQSGQTVTASVYELTITKKGNL